MTKQPPPPTGPWVRGPHGVVLAIAVWAVGRALHEDRRPAEPPPSTGTREF